MCISMSVRAKHSGSKSLVITNKLSAGMLRPYEYILNLFQNRLSGLLHN